MGTTNSVIAKLDARLAQPTFPEFRVGDSIRVHVRIVEGLRERVQVFEGAVIRRRRGGIRASFTVRKVSYGVGVERTFPLFSPRLEKIEVTARGRVRRNRLYYLRDLRGKAARIRERIEPAKRKKTAVAKNGTKTSKTTRKSSRAVAPAGATNETRGASAPS